MIGYEPHLNLKNSTIKKPLQLCHSLFFEWSRNDTETLVHSNCSIGFGRQLYVCDFNFERKIRLSANETDACRDAVFFRFAQANQLQHISRFLDGVADGGKPFAAVAFDVSCWLRHMWCNKIEHRKLYVWRRWRQQRRCADLITLQRFEFTRMRFDRAIDFHFTASFTTHASGILSTFRDLWIVSWNSFGKTVIYSFEEEEENPHLMFLADCYVKRGDLWSVVQSTFFQSVIKFFTSVCKWVEIRKILALFAKFMYVCFGRHRMTTGKTHSLTFDSWNLNKTFPALMMYSQLMTTTITMIMMPNIYEYVSRCLCIASFDTAHIFCCLKSKKYCLCKHQVLFSARFLSFFLFRAVPRIKIITMLCFFFVV